MLKKFNYEKFTIEQVQSLIKSGYFSEIICDADNKTIGILEEEYIEAEKAIKEKLTEIIKPISEAFCDVMKIICEAVQPVINAVWDLAKQINNKKLSKKKFMKLLQSQGIQRRDINKIVSNNSEPYTYIRYCNIVTDYQNNNRKNNK